MLNIFGAINSLGYGVHANNLIKALSDLGQEMTLTKLGVVQSDPYYESYWKAADKNIIKFNSDNPSLFIFHDDNSYQASGKPLMTFSIFETNLLKPLSKQILINGPTDMILATTSDHKNILIENGITKPIHVINEGVDDCIFNTIPCDKVIDTKKFTFITAGKRELRKSTDDIINAFMLTMKDKEVALIAHTFNPFINNTKDHPFKNLACWTGVNPQSYGFKYIGWEGKWHKFSNNKADIYFTAPVFQTPELPTLYHSANVGIACSKGEGWNLILTEMMACGLPCIATECLGHKEYLPGAPEIQQKLIIQPTGKEVANDEVWFKADQGEWSTFNVQDIADKMVTVLNNSNIYEIKSEELSNYITTNYNWKNAAEKIIKLY